MKHSIFLYIILIALNACDQPVEKERANPEDSIAATEASNQQTQAEELKAKGYQTFTYTRGDSVYLMQQYYVVFLKSGKNRSQDSTEAARLQEQHMAHLTRMNNEGYTSLTGPMGDDGELRGIVVYNTPTQREADSLARLDPMVQAGRLEVEVRPWWTAKGGKLN